MGALRLKDTMAAIAAALEEGGVVEKAWPGPVRVADVGHAVVGFPTDITFDMTFQRGSDTAVIPVWILAGPLEADGTLDELDRLLGDGAAAAKVALEDGSLGGLDAVLQALDVRTGGVDQVNFSGDLTYVAARFDCTVVS